MTLKTSEPGANEGSAFLISVKAAASWLGIPAFTLYSWTQTHRIPHYKLGKRVLFSKEDLERWLKDHRIGETG